jgi:hypothetical protein
MSSRFMLRMVLEAGVSRIEGSRGGRFAKIASLNVMSSLVLDLRPPIACLTLSRDVIGAAEIGDLASACESLAGDESVRVSPRCSSAASTATHACSAPK